jgi:hypothetical protein
MDNWGKVAARLKRLDGEIERLKTIEQPVTAIGGWLEIPNGSWSYASTTTITVPSGAASIYAVGDQVRLKQGGAYKYFYIVAVADTLLTVTGGSDYSVAEATITDAAFSKGGGVGHPGFFNYTVVWTATGTNPTLGNGTLEGRFWLSGRAVTIVIFLTFGSTTAMGTGNHWLSLPITAASGLYDNTARFRDAGVANYVRLASIITTQSPDNITTFTSLTGNENTWTPTIPFAMGKGDTLVIQLPYLAA